VGRLGGFSNNNDVLRAPRIRLRLRLDKDVQLSFAEVFLAFDFYWNGSGLLALLYYYYEYICTNLHKNRI